MTFIWASVETCARDTVALSGHASSFNKGSADGSIAILILSMDATDERASNT